MRYRERRKPTEFEVTLQTSAGDVVAVVLDATAGGARLRTDGVALEPETTLYVKVRGQRHLAAVVWVRDDEAGLTFQHPLPPSVLALLRRDMSVGKGQKKRRFVMP